MPRQKCDAFKVFEANLNRSRAFLRIFDGDGRAPGSPSNDEKELLRGAVVFAIGSLDAFLHDLVLEIVPRFGPSSEHLSDALKLIAKEDPSLSLRVALAPDNASRRAEFAAALDKWLSEKSFQGPEAVVRAIGYVGSSITWAEFDGACKRDGSAAELTRLTKMRHDIVHRGQRPYVVRKTAGDCVDLVERIAGKINREVIQQYYR